jgi:hypothetical protein
MKANHIMVKHLKYILCWMEGLRGSLQLLYPTSLCLAWIHAMKVPKQPA